MAAITAATTPTPSAAATTLGALTSIRRALVSRGTIVSGLAYVALLCTFLPWRTAVFVVLLMYAHEAGHLLPALIRRVQVRRPPFFVPGFGAYVVVASAGHVWDDVAITLAGPVIGGAVAAGAAALAINQRWFDLYAAAGAALLLNALNLAPFCALDGGRVSQRAGWLGVAATAAVAYGVWHFRLGTLFNLFALYCLYRAYEARHSTEPLPRQIAYVLALVSALALVVLLAWLTWPAAILGTSLYFRDAAVLRFYNTFVVLWGASLVADAVLWRPRFPRRLRYPLAALFKWPDYLFGRASRIPIMWTLAAQSVGLPGLCWLRWLVERWSSQRSAYAGEAAAYAYDFLGAGRADDTAAGRWLEEVAPAVGRAGEPAVEALTLVLRSLSHERLPTAWLRGVMAAAAPDDRYAIADWFKPENANLIAWDLLPAADYVTALPFAEAAVRQLPEDAASIDTLARVKLGLGDPSAAEALLRHSLTLLEHPGSLVVLARSLAAQGRQAEAVPYAETALEKFGGEWPSDEPSIDQVRAWIAEWRGASDQN